MQLSIYKMLLLFVLIFSWSRGLLAYTGDSVLQETLEISESALVLSKYLQFSSVSGNELEAGKFLAGYCAENGLEMEYFTTEEDSYNFAASLYPLSYSKPNIVLLHHIDVVPAGNTLLWEHPPYSGKIEEGFVWGRGAVDAKGLGIMQLGAILEIKKKADTVDFPFNVTLLCVSGEETGGAKGSAIIVKQFLKYLNPVVVFGEGGSGLRGAISSKPDLGVYGISVAEKKSMWLKLELQQVTFGHGATPAPEYANKSMIEALNRINTRKLRLEFDRSNRLMFRRYGKVEGGIRGFFISKINWAILSPFVKSYLKKNPLYKSLVTNTITITNISSPPGPPNKISSSASAVLDCRILPGTSKKAFLRYLTHLIDDPNIEISIINESVAGGFSKPDVFYDTMEEAIKSHDPEAEVVPILFPATTDNSFFRRYDVPTYGLIPAVITQELIANIHSVNERISLEMLDSGVAIYTTFLDKILTSPWDEKDLEKLEIDFKR